MNLLSPVVKLQLQAKTWSKIAFWNVPYVNAREAQQAQQRGGAQPHQNALRALKRH